MKKKCFFKGIMAVMFVICTNNVFGQISTNDLLQDTYELYDLQRQYNGVYLDSKIINGTDYHPCSVANTGVGLISLCVADRAGYITYARDLARQTLRTMLGYTPDFDPDRNGSGFYRHFIDVDTGNQAWNSEYSSIDTALLAIGALFAKKYFNDNEISAYADELFLSVDWEAAIANPSTGAIWRELDSGGNGLSGTSTLPFNEYIIVAYLAMKSEGGSGGAGTAAWNVWQQLGNFANSNYWGYELLTDDASGNAFLSDFTIQFPYYLISWAHNSPSYVNYMGNMASADKLYYQNISGNYPGLNGYEWGLGAGNSPGTFNGITYTLYGYNADRINEHAAHVVSPHIVAGYIPIRPSAKTDLQQMLSSNKGIYNLNTGQQLLWRYSLDEPTWNSDQIQGIDYSTMLYGLAADQFGISFFSNNNDYDFPVESLNSSGSCTGSAYQVNGTVLGSEGSWDGVSTRDKAFDNRNRTYFYGPSANDQWVGLDLGSYQNISCILFRPRRYHGRRMRGGQFQISHNANFDNPRTIYTVPTNANLGFRNYYLSSGGSSEIYARYIRYLSPNNGYGNIAEMKVYARSNASNRALQDDITLEQPIAENTDTSFDFIVSPNPTSRHLQLDFYVKKQGEVEFDLLSSEGRPIRSFSKRYGSDGAASETLDVSNLSQGIYFIALRSAGMNSVKKFVVQK
ncbi:T9SS type A sorting domain-containing protein [Sungkyunkwania multivorans]|uniref:T9SS type A sorting domain-containing protein n=1 Tax=Sungkyunkwania multivorans TaxID=1173618 RepID=A0ABW3CSD4_9FLAO